VTEFSFSDVRWKYLNIDYVVTARSDAWVANPDLSKVDEIGFTDLMPGSPDNHGHGAASTLHQLAAGNPAGNRQPVGVGHFRSGQKLKHAGLRITKAAHCEYRVPLPTTGSSPPLTR